MRPIMLVHGAWHGAWCWSMLQAELDGRGVGTYAIDLPGHGASDQPLVDLYGDAGAVASAVGQLGDDVVLVGHSYGGAVVSEAMSRLENVSHVVFVAAFALHVGESILSVLRALPRADVGLTEALQSVGLEHLDVAVSPAITTVTRIDPQRAVATLYGCTDAEVAEAAVQRLSPQSMDSFAQTVNGSALGVAETTYIRCSRDDVVHPTHQEAFANRCDYEHVIETDHSPFLSRPSELADLLEPLARATT
ncbi:MAG: alpha/beta fold hydrolase [Actinomycetota bacterium]|nr:alpha/beta fold hydrolase [Actinomycetota bacterium]